MRLSRLHQRMTRLFALLLLPFVLVLGAVPGATLFQCSMTGALAQAACCSDSDEHDAHRSHDAFEAQPCCVSLAFHVDTPPSECSRHGSEPSAPVALDLSLNAPTPQRVTVRITPRTSRRETGPPLRLKHASLQI